ncbi:hypothetical protein HUT16_04515 [Kitasatospora sp. NA04385]|uniref:SGNH/GDSL hydrolase family protein n=1 Tax=Kitasatospora sp. NA04385 TaxID=2742135 RepID=UPI001591C3BA|nr:SGNH/GDSL hydrolase family protein [Kitasatospora sp. NA04385]QKW18430.1 hypothetical protein HUT16_04515 [Kitasatospora sp. NA04385]
MRPTVKLGPAAATVVAAIAATTPTPSAVAPAPAPVLRVMPLGDSITAGYRSTTDAGYRGPLADLAAQPDVVLLHIGINDLDRGTDKAHAADRASALIDRILADRPGATVLVMGLIPTTPNLTALVADYNTALSQAVQAKQAQGRKVRYTAAPALTAEETADGLHPDDLGYRRIAQTFDQVLDRAFTDGLAVPAAVHHAGTESGGSSRVRWADFDGDGRSDYVVVEDGGAVRVRLNRGGEGHGGWSIKGRTTTGQTTAFLNNGGHGANDPGWIDYGRIANGV